MSTQTQKNHGFMTGIMVAGLLAVVAWYFTYGEGRDVRPGMEGVAKAKSIYEQVIEDFDAKSGELSMSLLKGTKALTEFQQALKEAKDVHAELSKVSNKWNRIKEDTKYVKKEFEELVKSADNFFSEVMSRADMIKKESLKRQTLASISQKKDNYVITLKKTRKSLIELEQAYIEVNDMMIAVEVHYSMKMFDEKVDETLLEISQIVSSVRSDLEIITKESRALLELGS